MKVLLLALLALVSMMVPAQNAAVRRMNETVGATPLVVLVALLVGAAFLAMVWGLGILGRGDVAQISAAPWWTWTPGLILAVVVMSHSELYSRVGAGAAVAVGVAGQLAASMVLDHFGWLGLHKTPMSVARVVGVVLVMGGTLLIQKK